jgi:ribose 5-phosphate isomerase A
MEEDLSSVAMFPSHTILARAGNPNEIADLSSEVKKRQDGRIKGYHGMRVPTMIDPSEKDAQKQRAAHRALKLVSPGMTVGLGSGSTAALWIRLLGEQVRDHGLKIRAIASSEDSERLGRSFGIPIISFDECEHLDLTVDGADEIAPGLALIKGGGGKLLREKIVASATRHFVIVADESKIVKTLGTAPLPAEVIPMAAPLVRNSLRNLGFDVNLRLSAERTPYITDEGNLLFDCSGMQIEDPERLAALLDRIVGLVEHGLFLRLAQLAIVATREGVIERTA